MKRVAIALVAVTIAIAVVLSGLVWALQAPHLPTPERRSWWFRDVVLVEPGRAPRPGATLRVENGRLVDAGNDPLLRAEAEAETADLRGLYVSPGLTDLHVHYPPSIAIGNPELWSLLLLAHGVTSIRETGSIDGGIFAVREAISAGRFPGPRIFACGAMLDGPQPSFPSNRVVATPDDAREAVTELAAEGADCIKAYNMLSREALVAIRETAARFDLPVIGHAPHSVALEEAGLVDLQHGTGAVVVDRDRVGRSDFLSADWATVDDARIAHVARVSLAQDIAHTPTLVNARMRRLLAEGDRAREAMHRDSGLSHLPRFWTDAWATIWGPPFRRGDAGSEARHELFRARQAALTAQLHRAGVRIHAGTDTLMPFVAPGSSLHGELADLVRAGIAADEVWEIATREAGRTLGLPGLGTLDVGAPADLVFLRRDPSGDVTAFREIEAVLADGRLYRRSDLEALLAIADAHFRGFLYSRVMDAVVAVVKHGFAPDRDVAPTTHRISELAASPPRDAPDGPLAP